MEDEIDYSLFRSTCQDQNENSTDKNLTDLVKNMSHEDVFKKLRLIYDLNLNDTFLQKWDEVYTDFCYDRGMAVLLGINYNEMHETDCNKIKYYTYLLLTK